MKTKTYSESSFLRLREIIGGMENLGGGYPGESLILI